MGNDGSEINSCRPLECHWRFCVEIMMPKKELCQRVCFGGDQNFDVRHRLL